MILSLRKGAIEGAVDGRSSYREVAKASFRSERMSQIDRDPATTQRLFASQMYMNLSIISESLEFQDYSFFTLYYDSISFTIKQEGQNRSSTTKTGLLHTTFSILS